MSTYLDESGGVCEHVIPARVEKWDKFGKKIVTDVFECFGFEVTELPYTDGKKGWADLLAVRESKKYRLEAEAKPSPRNWHYALHYGVDIPYRKGKYKDMNFHVMVKGDGNEVIITDRILLDYALEGKRIAWELKPGQRETVLLWGEKGCQVIRKYANSKAQDFIRIPTENTMIYRRANPEEQTLRRWVKKKDRGEHVR